MAKTTCYVKCNMGSYTIDVNHGWVGGGGGAREFSDKMVDEGGEGGKIGKIG